MRPITSNRCAACLRPLCSRVAESRWVIILPERRSPARPEARRRKMPMPNLNTAINRLGLWLWSKTRRRPGTTGSPANTS